jgi:hypothetical protein
VAPRLQDAVIIKNLSYNEALLYAAAEAHPHWEVITDAGGNPRGVRLKATRQRPRRQRLQSTQPSSALEGGRSVKVRSWGSTKAKGDD